MKSVVFTSGKNRKFQQERSVLPSLGKQITILLKMFCSEMQKKKKKKSLVLWYANNNKFVITKAKSSIIVEKETTNYYCNKIIISRKQNV